MHKLRIVFYLMLGATTFLPFAAGSQFATFTDVSSSDSYSYTNNVTSATFDTINEPVTFTFDVGQYAGQSFAAVLNISINTLSPVGQVSFSSLTYDVENLQSGSFSIILDSALNGETNALSGSFNGTLDGVNAGPVAVIDSDTSVSNSLTFTSDFLTFGGNEALQLGTSDANPGLSIGPGGFYNTFVGDYGPGAFTADSVTSTSAAPEPASFWLLILAVPALVIARRKCHHSATTL
jgi:hypothetical protein